ncbi:hypothetical protein ACHAWF_009570 [Thalassiosira exigua]
MYREEGASARSKNPGEAGGARTRPGRGRAEDADAGGGFGLAFDEREDREVFRLHVDDEDDDRDSPPPPPATPSKGAKRATRGRLSSSSSSSSSGGFPLRGFFRRGWKAHFLFVAVCFTVARLRAIHSASNRLQNYLMQDDDAYYPDVPVARSAAGGFVGQGTNGLRQTRPRARGHAQMRAETRADVSGTTEAANEADEGDVLRTKKKSASDETRGGQQLQPRERRSMENQTTEGNEPNQKDRRAHVVYAVDERNLSKALASARSVLERSAHPQAVALHFFRLRNDDGRYDVHIDEFDDVQKLARSAGASVELHRYTLAEVEPFARGGARGDDGGEREDDPSRYVKRILPKRLPYDACLWMDAGSPVTGDVVALLTGSRRERSEAAAAFVSEEASSGPTFLNLAARRERDSAATLRERQAGSASTGGEARTDRRERDSAREITSQATSTKRQAGQTRLSARGEMQKGAVHSGEERLSPATSTKRRAGPNPDSNYASKAESEPRYRLDPKHGKWFARVVRTKLKREEERKKRAENRTVAMKTIRADFRRLHEKVDTIERDEVLNDPKRWHAVTKEGYRETVKLARASVDEAAASVHNECVLWLVPPSSPSSSDASDPELRFQCGEDEDELREEPCAAANLCLVRSDAGAWRDHWRDDDELEKQLMPKKKEEADDGGRRPSAILTMVDGVRYLRHGGGETDPDFIWRCFLNKASYALRTRRDFYVWIGKLDSEILRERNVEVVERTFGSRCDYDAATDNSVNYYKPVAFEAFFRRTARGGGADAADEDEERRVWFADADTLFDFWAFPPAAAADDDENGATEAEMSLDDYFDLSPQASLLGSQNPSQTDTPILMNGGLLGLRGRSPRDRDGDDWIRDFSALWWYCRCGDRDQGALWLTLFATWSAESDDGGGGSEGGGGGGTAFAYPGAVFDHYVFARAGAFPHARSFLPKLREMWTGETSAAARGASPWSTLPADADYFDGGDCFSHRGRYSRPLELPHVLLLPLDHFEVPPSSGDNDRGQPPRKGRTDFPLGLARKDQPGKRALLSHTKHGKPCDGLRCWPFVIQGDSNNLSPPKTKERRRRRNNGCNS